MCIHLEPDQKHLLILLLCSLNIDYSYHYFIHLTEFKLFITLLYLLHRIYNPVKWLASDDCFKPIWSLGISGGSGSQGSAYESSNHSFGILLGYDMVQTGTQIPTFCISLLHTSSSCPSKECCMITMVMKWLNSGKAGQVIRIVDQLEW